MKIVRIILIIAGTFAIVSQSFFIVAFAVNPGFFFGESHPGFWDKYLAPLVYIIIGGIFLFIAGRISRKIKKKQSV